MSVFYFFLRLSGIPLCVPTTMRRSTGGSGQSKLSLTCLLIHLAPNSKLPNFETSHVFYFIPLCLYTAPSACICPAKPPCLLSDYAHAHTELTIQKEDIFLSHPRQQAASTHHIPFPGLITSQNPVRNKT